MNPSVVFAFKSPQVDDPSVCHAGMGITATNLAMSLQETRTQAAALPVTNGEYLWSQLSGAWSNNTHVVMCAPYIDAPFLTKMVNNFKTKKFAMVYHSNLGFLTVDKFAATSLPALMSLSQASPNFTVAGNSKELATAMSAATGGSFGYLPNLYHLPSMTRRTRPAWKPGMVLNVGLFGAARVLKNWLTAVTSAMIMQRTLKSPVRLHMNSGRDENPSATRQTISSVLGMNKDVTPVDVPWLGFDDFRRYIYGMDIMLQPSFTETFNNVTADGISGGVPSVVSEAIDWVPSNWIAKADSACDIARVGCKLVQSSHAAMDGWKALDRYNKAALPLWQKWLA